MEGGGRLVSRTPEGSARDTPLLFVHGAWSGGWVWQENFVPYFLERGLACHALDLRGHGPAGGRRRIWHSLNDYVDDFAAAVRHIGKTPVAVGHSMGGGIVQKYLENADLAGAVLMASLPPSGAARVFARSIRRHPLVVLRSLLLLDQYVGIAGERARGWFFSEDFPRELSDRYQPLWVNESARAPLGLNRLRTERISGRTPMLVLGAEDDVFISVAEVEETAKAFDVRAEISPDMAHYMPLEVGWESVAKHITEWVDAIDHS